MKDQINTIRELLNGMALAMPATADKALTALTQLEAMAGEPVAWLVCSVNSDGSLSLEHAAAWKEAAHDHINDAITEHGIEEAASWVVRPAYVAAPVAHQQRDDYKAWYDEAMCASNEAGFVGLSAAQTIKALSDEVAELKHTQAEPVHWRAVLDPEQVPQQLKTTMHVVGFREKKAAEGFVAEQIDFYGWRYTIEPLYAAPVAQQPQADTCQMCGDKPHPGCNSEFQGDKACRFWPAPDSSYRDDNYWRGWNAAIRSQQPQAEIHDVVAYADRIAFLFAMKDGKGCDVWPKAGDYEQRTGRKLIALRVVPDEPKPLFPKGTPEAIEKARNLGLDL